MLTNKKKGAPFGSSVKRFGKITVHPNVDSCGLCAIRPNGCDPCRYRPLSIHNIFQVKKNSKFNKDPWKYKTELEEWAKNLGYRNQKVLDQRKWFKSILGPAWHNIESPAQYEAACKNVGFGRTPRFKPSKNVLPGPGTYYKAIPFKIPYGPHSLRPTLEREEPCRFKDPTCAWSLAANRYKIIDKECIEEKSKRIVSLRGPYDLFTGNRNGSVKNHFNNSLKCSAATWPIGLKSTLDKYKNSHFGSMNKTNQNIPHRGRNTLTAIAMCIRKLQDPGPAYTNLDKPKVFIQNKYGFNSSYDKPPGYKRVVVWPGVGRHSIKNITCGISGQGHRHVFLSTQERTIGASIPKPMNSF